MKKFAASKMDELIRLTAKERTVYLPAEKDELISFDRFEEGVKVNLDKVSTDKSPKDVLFPQWENLMHFRMEGKNISITEQERSEEPFVIFGIRACDIQAFEVLDRVFLAPPQDTYYAARREHGTLVSIACENPEKSCFCGVFGIDPAAPKADVTLWKCGDSYYCDAATEKGKKLMAAWPLEDADSAPVDEAKKSIEKKLSEQPFAKLSLDGIKGMTEMEMFESPKWDKLSMACIGCGSCTFSCPTCQCYDIRDYDSGKGIDRYRCWDSCMYSDFTLMAATNPRTTQKQRYRQRFMHKLKYYPENNEGLFSCVGCGRCVRKCPMNLNIAKVIKAFGEEKK